MLCGVGIGLDSARLLATGLAVVKHMDRLSGQPSFREYGQTDRCSVGRATLWVAYRTGQHDSSGRGWSGGLLAAGQGPT